MKQAQITGQTLSDEAREHLKRTIMGSNLYTRRSLLNLSSEDMAKDLNISVEELKAYETGEKEISAVMLYRLATYLNVSTDYFTQDTADQTDEYEDRPLLKNLISSLLHFLGRLKLKTPH